jgi:hypothetical protein
MLYGKGALVKTKGKAMKRKKTGFGMIILMVLGTEALLFACQTQKKAEKSSFLPMRWKTRKVFPIMI